MIRGVSFGGIAESGDTTVRAASTQLCWFIVLMCSWSRSMAFINKNFQSGREGEMDVATPRSE